MAAVNPVGIRVTPLLSSFVYFRTNRNQTFNLVSCSYRKNKRNHEDITVGLLNVKAVFSKANFLSAAFINTESRAKQLQRVLKKDL